MLKIYYEDIYVGEIITNQSLTVEEALDLLEFDEQTFLNENQFDAIDYNDFRIESVGNQGPLLAHLEKTLKPRVYRELNASDDEEAKSALLDIYYRANSLDPEVISETDEVIIYRDTVEFKGGETRSGNPDVIKIEWTERINDGIYEIRTPEYEVHWIEAIIHDFGIGTRYKLEQLEGPSQQTTSNWIARDMPFKSISIEMLLKIVDAILAQNPDIDKEVLLTGLIRDYS